MLLIFSNCSVTLFSAKPTCTPGTFGSVINVSVCIMCFLNDNIYNRFLFGTQCMGQMSQHHKPHVNGPIHITLFFTFTHKHLTFYIFSTNLVLVGVKFSFICFSFTGKAKKPLHFFMEGKFIINFFVRRSFLVYFFHLLCFVS